MWDTPICAEQRDSASSHSHTMYLWVGAKSIYFGKHESKVQVQHSLQKA